MSLTSIPDQLPLSEETHLKEYLAVFRRRRVSFLLVFFTVLGLGIAYTATRKPVYQTSAKLLVPAPSYAVNFVDSSNPIGMMLAATQPDSLATQLQVLRSGPYLESAFRAANIQPKPDVVPPAVRVEQLADSNVIQITVSGGDREDIARLANAMVDVHLHRTTQHETTGVEDAIGFVRQEVEKAERELQAAKERLIAFRRDHRIVQLAAEQEAQAKEYVGLQARVREAETNVATTQAQLAELQGLLAKEPLEIVKLGTKENPRRAKLETRLDELKMKRMELARDFRPTSRVIQDLDRDIARVQAEYDREPETLRVRTHEPNLARQPLLARLMELKTNLQGHQAARRAAEAQLRAKKGVVDNLGPWEVEQAQLLYQRDEAQQAHSQLTNRLRDLEIRARAHSQMAREVERASVPNYPVRPQKTLYLAMSAILALFLASGVAFLRDYMDDRVHSGYDVERLAGLPALGHVPVISPRRPRLIAALPPNSQVAEAYRTVRSSINFAGAESPIRRLVVTSPAKGEGKTTTSINLATAMALEGKRVMLVDADLRQPSIHRLLRVPNVAGLSDVLRGTKRAEEVIRPTQIENVRVIPSGSLPPNPAELLASPSFEALLAELEEEADIIILDTPPCLPVTDPLIAAALADGVVLVLHLGETREAGVRRAVELLTRARARILGLVLNRVRYDGGEYYYYERYAYGDGVRNGDGGWGEPSRPAGQERRITPGAGAREAGVAGGAVGVDEGPTTRGEG